MTKKYEGKWDYVKVLLSILVVANHTHLLPEPLAPIHKIAVPFFFIISSVFLANKISKPNDTKVVFKYCWRILILYLSWSVILFPVCYFHNNWMDNSIIKTLGNIVTAFVSGETFIGSWYLFASAISALIVYASKNRLYSFIISILSFVAYAFVCITTSYHDMLPQDGFLIKIHTAMSKWLCPEMSFLVGLSWFTIGKVLSNFRLSPHIKTPSIIALTIISTVLLWIESSYCRRAGLTQGFPCYFSMILVCVSIYFLVSSLPHIEGNSNMRKISTLIYCMHGSIMIALAKITGPISSSIRFSIVLLLSIGISLLLLMLDSKKRAHAIIKYLY